MKKILLSAAALSLFCATSAFAQTEPTTKSDGDKTKTTTDGMTVKTKMQSDGKMKVKGKDDQGNSMKAYTKPRKGDMKGDMKMDGDMSMKGDHKMHHKGMKKGMRKDSTSMRPGGM